MSDNFAAQKARNFARNTLERGGHMVALDENDVAVRWCDVTDEPAESWGFLCCSACRGFAWEALPEGMRRRCAMCDEWYVPQDAGLHAHVLPQSGGLQTRWVLSGLLWSELYDIDDEAKKWGHRDALS